MRGSLCALEFDGGFRRRKQRLACLNERRRGKYEFALRLFVSGNGLDGWKRREIDLMNEAVRFV